MFEYIIFAHNDVETRSFLYEIFTNLGYRITTVPTHREVLEILKKDRPDYIILDPSISDIPLAIATEEIKMIDSNINVQILPSDKNIAQFIKDMLEIIKKQPISSSQETKKSQLMVKILAVDDEKECLELLKNYLSRKGYNADCASSGEEAMFKIKTSPPDIVLLDIRMSGMDGIIVLKAIKEIDKSIIVIMTSAVEDDEIIKKALSLGADGYLVKPFNLAKLETMILSKTLQNYLK